MDERRQSLTCASRREPAAARRSPFAGGTWTSTPAGCRSGAASVWSRPRAPASSSSRDRRTGQARVVDIDADTVAALRVYRATRGSLTHELVPDAALVLGNLDGTHRHPERYARRFAGQVVQARTALGRSDSRRSGCTTCGT